MGPNLLRLEMLFTPPTLSSLFLWSRLYNHVRVCHCVLVKNTKCDVQIKILFHFSMPHSVWSFVESGWDSQHCWMH